MCIRDRWTWAVWARAEPVFCVRPCLSPDCEKRPHALADIAPGLTAGFACNGRGIAMTIRLGRELAQWAQGAPLADLSVPSRKISPIVLHGLMQHAPQALLHPRWALDFFWGGRAAPAAYQALTYTDAFLQHQAPWLLALLLFNIPVFIAVIVKGRWTATLRRIEQPHSASWRSAKAAQTAPWRDRANRERSATTASTTTATGASTRAC